MSDMTVWVRFLANASGLKRELRSSQRESRTFTQSIKRDFENLKGTLFSVKGALAGIGVTFGVMTQLVASARLDKGLGQVRQTAGATKDTMRQLRGEFFRMSKETGQPVEGLKEGFDRLIQSGQNVKEAKETIQGINTAMAVTGAQADTLANGLTTAQAAFQFDLSKPGMALILLDKMTVAGRLGNAELENLSDIFGRVGVNAAAAGMSFDKTLSFVESLSMLEKNPERLATLADSTLRVFTNMRYMKDAQKATGIKFFDAKGQRRDALAVLKDIKKQYDTLKTDEARARFIQRAFGATELDTIRGLRTLMQGDALGKMEEFTSRIAEAGGTLKRDLPDAINNAVDQTGRLKAALKEAADSFAQPINNAWAEAVKFSLAKKEEGGLDLSGKQILLGGGALALGTILAAFFGNKGIQALTRKAIGKAGGTAAGVAEGKLLQAAAGVTPVFVVNWPGGLNGGSAGSSGDAMSGMFPQGAGAALKWVGLPLAAGVTAYAVTSGINQLLGDPAGALGRWLFDMTHKQPEVKTNITVNVDRSGRVVTTTDNAHAKTTVKRGSFRG